MSIAIVCGGRDYTDADRIKQVMQDAHLRLGVSIFVQGGCPTGADYLAKQWCAGTSIHCAQVDAKWKTEGKSAGPKRNSAMLLFKPDYVIAFPGGTGTADMVRKAKAAGVTVLEIVP
jgi:hypothetical protein